MDLTKKAPRSPFAELAGYPWLPRIIDKATAHAAGTAGEYNYSCPMDSAFLEFYGLTSDQFLGWIEAGASDDQIVAEVRLHALERSPDDVRKFKIALLDTPPPDPGKRQYLEQYRSQVAPDRPELDTFAKVIAVEEGHPLPATVA